MAQVITVNCPLGSDVFGFRSMTGDERLSTPFRYEVLLYSSNREIKANSLLGQPMTIKVELGEKPPRFYNGIVASFGYVGETGRYTTYKATLRPWHFLLTRTATSRIFQNKSVPDIIKEVFRGHAFSDFEQVLGRTYKPRTFCVQYRESDFNFISRLMEHEGIYYFVEHQDGKHTLVLFDSESSHEKVSGYEKLTYRPTTGSAEASDEPSFTSWTHIGTVQPGTYTLRDYDYLKPNADLTVKTTVDNAHTHDKFEVYDYPGAYVQATDGEMLARVRIEAMRAEQSLASGSHTGLGLYAGSLVGLSGFYPRPSEDGEYLVVGQHFDLVGSTFESGKGADARFSCDAVLLDSRTPFAPPRVTPVPTVQGPQTATIAGKSEVWTDDYGRVKLKFHWDRSEDAGGEQSSCWVRVSQNSASAGWGSMFVPHVGDEVIVEFLEGDPDQPIVTGRVYNANKTVPLTLPANDKKSIFRDHFGNEMIFDGTAGQEHITFHTPSKATTLQLGKSFRWFTVSNSVSCTKKSSISYTLGDSWNFSRGATGTVTRGAWFGVKFGIGADVGLGASASIWGGLKLNFAAGVSFDVTKTSKVTYTYDNQWNAAKGNLSVRSEKDVLIDSQKTLRMTGGDNDRSLIVCDNDAVTVTYDPSPAKRDMTKISAGAIAVAGAASGILAAAAGLSSWQYSAQTDVRTERTNGTTPEINLETSQLEAFTEGDVTTYCGVLAGVLTASLVGKPSDAAAPQHSGATSKLRLEADKAMLQAGKDDAIMVLSKDAGFNLETKKNIMLDSDGAIAYKAKKNIDITANQTNFDAIIKHKNLTVLK